MLSLLKTNSSDPSRLRPAAEWWEGGGFPGRHDPAGRYSPSLPTSHHIHQWGSIKLCQGGVEMVNHKLHLFPSVFPVQLKWSWWSLTGVAPCHRRLGQVHSCRKFPWVLFTSSREAFDFAFDLFTFNFKTYLVKKDRTNIWNETSHFSLGPPFFINWPPVAGAVLQTPPLLIESVS